MSLYIEQYFTLDEHLYNDCHYGIIIQKLPYLHIKEMSLMAKGIGNCKPIFFFMHAICRLK